LRFVPGDHCGRRWGRSGGPAARLRCSLTTSHDPQLLTIALDRIDLEPFSNTQSGAVTMLRFRMRKQAQPSSS
jgi:hypothetical protein